MGPETFPRRFGPYVLLQPLGSGGMGHVTVAMSGQRGREKLCVVKRMHPEVLSVPEQVARFQHEATVARRLSHGAIVQTLGLGEVDGEPYIAQDLIEGRDLGYILSRFQTEQDILPVPLSVHIIREVARGLAYAHDFEGLGLVHRDISPQNVRIGFNGEVKLLDFGIATSSAKDFLTLPGQQVGKRSFMAPEQLAGKKADRRADLHALGVLLWELLTGRPTHVALPESPQALASQAGPPSLFNAAVPADLDAVVAKALSPAPEDRFQTASEMRAALADFIPQRFDGDAELARYLVAEFDPAKERTYRAKLVAEAGHLLDSAEPAVVVAPRTRLALPVAMAMGGLVVVALAYFALRPHVPVVPAAPMPTPVAVAPPTAPSTVPPTPRPEITREITPPAPARPHAPVARKPVVPPVDPGTLVADARRAFNRQSFDEAIRLAETAVRTGGGLEAHLLLANTYLKTGHLDEAEQHFAEVVRIDPAHVVARDRLDFTRRLKEAHNAQGAP